MNELKYKRVLLKVSGEALGEKTAQGDGFGLDFAKMNAVAASSRNVSIWVSRWVWSSAAATSGGA